MEMGELSRQQGSGSQAVRGNFFPMIMQSSSMLQFSVTLKVIICSTGLGVVDIP